MLLRKPHFPGTAMHPYDSVPYQALERRYCGGGMQPPRDATHNFGGQKVHELAIRFVDQSENIDTSVKADICKQGKNIASRKF